MILHSKDMGIQVGDPLAPFLRHVQIPQPILDVGVDHIPVEGGVVTPEVVRGLKAQQRIGTRFFKFVKEGGKLAHMLRVAKLPD